MTVNYTSLLSLGQPVTGTESGTWGDDVNNAVTSYLDIAIAGSLSLSTDADVTLTKTQGTSTATNIGSTTAQYAVLNCTGARTAQRNISVPNTSKTYVILNQTTGGYAVKIRGVTGPTTGVTVANGKYAVVAWAGSDFVIVATNDVISLLGGPLPVANGGTGATTLTGLVLGNGTSAFTAVTAPTGAVVGTTDSQTLSNKTLTSPIISAISNTGTLTLPTSTDTLVGRATTDTLTNKTLTNPAINGFTGDTSVINVGSGQFYKATDGKVGIGTTSPASLLAVNGDASVNGVAIGCGAAGNSNTLLGRIALNTNSIGVNNTAIGRSALYSTTGDSNTGVGRDALANNSSGTGNTAIGQSSLSTSTTTNYSTAVGYQALLSTNYANTSGLGANSAVTGANQVQLGDSATTTYAYGAVQNRSDARDKADIRNTQLGLSFICALRPVDYKWNYREDYKEWVTDKDGKPQLIQRPQDGSKKRNRYHHGLIAQEVKSVLDSMGIDFGGYQDHSVKGGQDVLSIGYMELVGPMIKAIQELKAEVEALKAKLA